MHIQFMTDDTNNDIAGCCAGNGCLAAIFISFVIFAFGDAICLGFVQGIDLVLVLGLLV